MQYVFAAQSPVSNIHPELCWSVKNLWPERYLNPSSLAKMSQFVPRARYAETESPLGVRTCRTGVFLWRKTRETLDYDGKRHTCTSMKLWAPFIVWRYLYAPRAEKVSVSPVR